MELLGEIDLLSQAHGVDLPTSLAAVQPHGVVFVLDEADIIQQIGGDTAGRWGWEPSQLIGKPFGKFFEPQPQAGHFFVRGRELPFEGTRHVRSGYSILEIRDEPRREVPMAPRLTAVADAVLMVTRLQERGITPAKLAAEVVHQFRDLTGYDRVMVCRFNTDGHAEVVAEANTDGMASFLGLWLLASDFSVHDRALYYHERLRALADVDAEPWPLLPDSPNGRVDLSGVKIRAFPPEECQHLRNMGVRATLVASIVDEDRLIGLIVCHHRTPRQPSRGECRLLETFALQLATKWRVLQLRERADGTRLAQTVLSLLPSALYANQGLEAALVSPAARLMEMLDADGIAVLPETGESRSRGQVPPTDEIRAIVAWLESRGERQYATNSLRQALPGLTTEIAGLAALRFPLSHGGWLLWFRNEEITTIRWIRQYTACAETVRGTSRPWSEAERAILDDVVRSNLSEALLDSLARRESDLRWRLQAIGDNLPLGAIYQFHLQPDGRGQYTFMSRSGERILGHPIEALLADPALVRNSIHPDDRPRLVRLADVSRETLEVFDCETRYIHPNGDTRWLHLRSQPRRESDGSTIWNGVMLDITRRRTAEQSLRSAVEQYELLAENTRDLVTLCDRGMAFCYASPSLTPLLGYAPADVLGHTAEDLLHPDSLPVYRDSFQQVMAGEQVRREYCVKHREGRWVWIETQSSPVRDANGLVINMLCTSRDISERRAIEEQLRQAQKLDAIGRLAAGVAHDFNNLLMVVCGYTEAALAETPNGDPRRELLEQVYKAGQHGSALTRQMLAFSRQQVAKPQPLDLNASVEAAGKMIRRLLGDDVAMHFALDATTPIITADAGQIEQVFINLVVNARDAMPRGGRLTIGTRTHTVVPTDFPEAFDRTAGRYHMLSVRDTGVGISPEARGRLFEPFFTTKPPGRGTGLGLATVYGIVKSAGGFIVVSTPPGGGTEFRVFFPECHQSPEPTLPKPPDACRQGSGGVMVIDDDDAVRRLVSRVLQREGYEVHTADTPAAIMDLVRSADAPRLLLTDVVMADVNGREVAEAFLKAHPEGRVIFMSGFSGEALLKHGIDAERVRFLQKPFEARKLVEEVQAALAIRSLVPTV